MKLTRPAIRYHGGKWRLAKWIVSHFPAHKVYTEAYGGAASVLLWKDRSHAEIYNDLDDEIVNLFRCYRDHGEQLIEKIQRTPFSRKEFEQAYIKTGNDLEDARRMLVRGFMGFGSSSSSKASKGSPTSGFRSNSNRSGTTPAHDWKAFPGAIPAIIDRLQGVVIENKDASEVIKTHDCLDALHYIDPPYVSETRDSGTDYRYELTNNDHIELCEFIKSLQGSVVLSGYNNDIYNDALCDWIKVERNALADGAQKRIEVLWIKGDLPQSQLFDLEDVA